MTNYNDQLRLQTTFTNYIYQLHLPTTMTNYDYKRHLPTTFTNYIYQLRLQTTFTNYNDKPRLQTTFTTLLCHSLSDIPPISRQPRKYTKSPYYGILPHLYFLYALSTVYYRTDAGGHKLGVFFYSQL